MNRRYAILAPDRFKSDAKTAHGVIRYGSDEVVAVIDPSNAGRRVREVLGYLDSEAPIVASVAEALEFSPNALLIGTAPKGGGLPPAWRSAILEAIGARLEIVSGLHEMLDEDREFRVAARAAGTAIWDVREPPDVPLFSGDVYAIAPPVLLTVGNDCAVGKMTVSLELVRAANAAGRNARFVPTGQTGVLIAGWGISVDRVISDFAPGAAEQLVLYAVREGADLHRRRGTRRDQSSGLRFGHVCADDRLCARRARPGLRSSPRADRILSDADTRVIAKSIAIHEQLLGTR